MVFESASNAGHQYPLRCGECLSRLPRIVKVSFFLPPPCLKGMRWRDQVAIWKRLAAGSATLRRRSIVYLVVSIACYVAFFTLVVVPLLEPYGAVACGLFAGITYLILDEALKHLIVAPQIERELARGS